MKMKLAQRIAIGYYKAKFNTLSLLSKRTAAKSAFKLFCTPYSGKPKRKIPPIFHRAEKLRFVHHGLHLHGWKWKPEQWNGKRILIVHGFDSCSYKFDRYIVPLNREGYEVVAFDAPGHGISAGRTVNALVYSEAILKAEEMFGSFYGVMAHSFGGLATALAFEQLPDLQKRKLVLIAPSTETTTAIDNFLSFLQLPNHLKDSFNELIKEIANKPAEFFSVKRAIQNIQAPVLWVHDEEDWVCPYKDVKPVQELQLPNVEFFITKGLGHSGIYKQNNVFRKIMEFFKHAE